MKRFLFLLIIALMLVACGGSCSSSVQESGDSIVFKYAQLIHIEECDGYRVVRVDNPWRPGKVLHRYVLLPANQAPPQGLPEGTVVRIPLQRSVIFTSVHAALVGQLGAERRVAGVADLKYMKIPYVQQGVVSGEIVDCGDGMSPFIEKIIDVGADGILLSPFENSGGYGRLEEVDIPLIECAEYMESSPLGRAEWMRFYGMLFGAEREADSLFAVVDSSYQQLCRLASTSTTRPSVLVDKQVGSVWYVPGGCSTIGQMLADAQCNYPFATDTHSGSLPLPFETVLEKAGDAEVWLFRYDSDFPITLSRLLAEQRGYSQLQALGTGEVYGCNVRTSLFYEQSPFRPDLLLQDFIQIFHPDLQLSESLRYYRKLEQ